MNNEPKTNSEAHTKKLSAEIKKTWNKLSDQDVALQATSPDKFYEAVTSKQGITKAEAEKIVQKLDADCAAACKAEKANDASLAPKKAANA